MTIKNNQEVRVNIDASLVAIFRIIERCLTLWAVAFSSGSAARLDSNLAWILQNFFGFTLKNKSVFYKSWQIIGQYSILESQDYLIPYQVNIK